MKELLLTVRSCVATLAVYTVLQGGAFAEWTMVNPTGRSYENELVRVKVSVPADATQESVKLLEDGKEVACQVENMSGGPAVWVMCNLKNGEKHVYALEKGKPGSFEKRVKISRDGSNWVMDNGRIAIRVPAESAGETIPPPVEAVRLPSGKWVGKGAWNTDRKLKSFSSKVVGDGTLFGKVRLEYAFEGTAGVDNIPAYYSAEVTLPFDRSHAVVEEAYEMSRNSHWEFNAASGWSPRKALTIPHFGGFGREDIKDEGGNVYAFPPVSLKYGQTRMGDRLLNLVPRWSQAYDDGWFFATDDGENAVGALVCRAGKWLWPYDGMVEIRVKKSADYAGFRCPTWRGKRYWMLLAGKAGEWPDKKECEEYVIRHSFESLDKIHQDYVIDWPGLKPADAPGGEAAKESTDYSSGAGRFGGRNKPFFGWGPGSGRIAGDNHPITSLIRAQVLLDPDTFGDYWRFYSSENPNFATSWWGPLFSEVAKCSGHPQFKQLVEMAKMNLMSDMYHSITMPGGAGQECPGYAAGAISHLQRTARFCKENLGFDLTQDERFKAQASFLLRISHPMGNGSRRSHPAGDTHPPGPDVYSMAESFNMPRDVTGFVSDELPGFGAILRNNPGTVRETYFAFKSGPNRGHYHGDQLSFHYGAFARMLMVDHHCSYGPRAGQEHMHNRVAFHTDKIRWGNMDGYERLIAFKTSKNVDVAMGQVESERLRVTEEFPPEKWDKELPQDVFDVPLKYRRTVVMVKGADRDYFVIRDQHVGPEVFATYCLHAYGSNCEQKVNMFNFDGAKLFVASPAQYDMSRYDWSHKNGGLEETKGLRLTVKGRTSEFITVLMPKIASSRGAARLVMKDALVRGDGAKSDLTVVCGYDGTRFNEDAPNLSAPNFNKGGANGTVSVKREGQTTRILLTVNIGDDRWLAGGKGGYEIEVADDGKSAKFKGTFTPRLTRGKPDTGKPAEIGGETTVEHLKEFYDLAPKYSEEIPAISAISGGVKVGNDEVVFAGGIDDVDGTSYVVVKQDGKDAMVVSDKDIDMDRFQGQVGLFVPDAGYPFGVIPDWLIKQRCSRPSWYKDVWPLTGGQKQK